MKSIFYILLFLAAVFGFQACVEIFDLDAPQINQEDIEGYLTLTSEVDSSTLNPRILLTATIPPHVDDHEKRNIIFSTDKGNFVTTEDSKNSITVNATILGIAKAVLLTDGSTGQFNLKAQLEVQPEITTSDSVRINNSRDHILDAVIDPGPDLKANGQDVITIHCTINKNLALDKEYRLSLQHNVTGGKFVNTADSNLIDELLTKHENSYQLKAGLTPGAYDITIKIEALGISGNEQVMVRALQPNEVIRIDDFDSNFVLADGISIIKGKLTIENSTLSKIKVASTGGTLLLSDLNNVVLNSDNTIEFDYQLGTNVETNKITITVPHPTPIEQQIQFTPLRSYADDIFIELSQYVIDSMALNTTAVDITVSTRRDIGKVSIDTPVALRAFQIINAEEKKVGQFENRFECKTDENGDVTGIKFRPLVHTLQNTDDNIFIQAAVLNQDQDTIFTIAEIGINK
ncbi:MAG: hypothetical protein AAGA77_23640 [Bacteroidota bacterium]